MRRFWLGILVGVVIGALLATTGMGLAAQSIRLVVNGKEVPSVPPPQMIGGRVFVPIRFVAEALGAKVEWNGKKQIVTIYQGQSLLSIPNSSSSLTQTDKDNIDLALIAIETAFSAIVYQDGKPKVIPLQDMDASIAKQQYERLQKQLSEVQIWLPSTPKLYALKDAIIATLKSEMALLSDVYAMKEANFPLNVQQAQIASHYRTIQNKIELLRRELNAVGLSTKADEITRAFKWLLSW